MSKSKESRITDSNTLDRKAELRDASNEALSRNSLQGEAVVPIDTITDVLDGLSPASLSIACRSLAHSALFQAISVQADLIVARSQPLLDELAIERLERRAAAQAGLYNYFRDEAATHAESKYDEVMAYDDMFDFVLKAAPTEPTGDIADYDETFLKSIGLTVEQAMDADIEQYQKDLALFTSKIDLLKHNREYVRTTIKAYGYATPDIPVVQCYRMLQKVELKLSNEPVRLWPKRHKIPNAMSKMACITGDLPGVAKAIKKLRDAWKADDRVRFDEG